MHVGFDSVFDFGIAYLNIIRIGPLLLNFKPSQQNITGFVFHFLAYIGISYSTCCTFMCGCSPPRGDIGAGQPRKWSFFNSILGQTLFRGLSSVTLKSCYPLDLRPRLKSGVSEVCKAR